MIQYNSCCFFLNKPRKSNEIFNRCSVSNWRIKGPVGCVLWNRDSRARNTLLQRLQRLYRGSQVINGRSTKQMKMNFSVFIGRNCVINPQKGRICDYKHQFDIKGTLSRIESFNGLKMSVNMRNKISTKGMEAPKTEFFQFPTMINSQYDQILFSYRSRSEAIFR